MVCSYLAIGSASIQDVYLFKHSSYYYYHYSNPIHLSLSLSHRRRNQCSILVTPIPPSYYYYHYSNPIHLSFSLSHTLPIHFSLPLPPCYTSIQYHYDTPYIIPSSIRLLIYTIIHTIPRVWVYIVYSTNKTLVEYTQPPSLNAIYTLSLIHLYI